MRDGIWRWGVGILLLTLTLGLALTDPAQAQVVINELLADPGQDWNDDGELDTKLDEWVEVCNMGSEAAHLTQYWVRDGLGEAVHLNLFGVIDPGQTAVFYGSHAVAWQLENGAGSSGLSLNNGGDTVQLLRTDPENPDNLLVVDEKVYLGHEGAEDRACARVPDGGIWSLFDGLNEYDGTDDPLGTGCDPTPGATNDCSEGTPVEDASLSRVKAAFQD